MSAKELLTADDAATLLKIARRTLLKWARDGKIESVKVSRKIVLFTAEAIEGFLEAKTVAVKSSATIKPTPEIRSAKSPPKQRGKQNSRNQSWQEPRKEALSWIEQDKK